MVKCVSEKHQNGIIEVTYRYDEKNKKDRALIEKIEKIVSEQSSCFNCLRLRRVGCLGGYEACECEVHGNIEAYDNPHHDCDGSKCAEYCRKEETTNGS